jgi:hypothetical protein
MFNLPIAATLSMAITVPTLACDPPSNSGEFRNAAPKVTFAQAAAHTPLTIVTSNAMAFASDDDAVSEITIQSNDNGNKVEIHIRNDDVTAKVNGKDVPADRIQRDDHQIKILDEKGDVIYSSDLVFGIGDNSFRGFAFSPNADDPLGNAYTTWLTQPGFDFEPPKVMLGVHMDSPGPALEKQLHLDPDSTTLISGVYDKLPANLAGIQEYDIIVAIDGSEKADPQTVRDLLRTKEVGDTIGMDIIQAGQRKHITVTLEKYDAERMAQSELFGSADESFAVFGDGPGMLTLRQGPGGGNIGVIRPDQLRGLSTTGPNALAEVMRNRVGGLSFNSDSMREQMEDMRAQLEEMRKMMEEMMPPPQPPPAPKQEARPPKPNES